VAVDGEGQIERRRVAGLVVGLDAVVRSIALGLRVVVDRDEQVGCERVDQLDALLQVERERGIGFGQEISVDGTREIDLGAGLAQEAPQVQRHAQVDLRLLEAILPDGAAKGPAVPGIDEHAKAGQQGGVEAGERVGEFLIEAIETVGLDLGLRARGTAARGEHEREEHGDPVARDHGGMPNRNVPSHQGFVA